MRTQQVSCWRRMAYAHASVLEVSYYAVIRVISYLARYTSTVGTPSARLTLVVRVRRRQR